MKPRNSFESFIVFVLWCGGIFTAVVVVDGVLHYLAHHG
jgi:hypothetical protein